MAATDPSLPSPPREPFAGAERPLPAWVWLTLATLLSLCLFLWLRLMIQRSATPGPEAVPLPVRTEVLAPRAPLPAASDEALRALVEGWRRAWVNRDLDAYLGYYARTFGAQGKDHAAWAEHKAELLSGDDELSVEVSDLDVEVGQEVVRVRFVQTYRSGAYSDRGTKTLYLLAEDGAWRIFNEEWAPLD